MRRGRDGGRAPCGMTATWSYGIHVRGNTFSRTGERLRGTLTGAFFGPIHEGSRWVVERSDLSARRRRQTLTSTFARHRHFQDGTLPVSDFWRPNGLLRLKFPVGAVGPSPRSRSADAIAQPSSLVAVRDTLSGAGLTARCSENRWTGGDGRWVRSRDRLSAHPNPSPLLAR